MSSAQTTSNKMRFRSSTIGSIQSFGRAVRETLRIRRHRRLQRQFINQEGDDQMRTRSKSVGAASVDEISEVRNHAIFLFKFSLNIFM